MFANLQPKQPSVREGYLAVNHAKLYLRQIGEGQPVIILHGGPDFDHNYLLPDLDRLSTFFHLIYYDQRGRGKSGAQVEPAEVTLASEIEDLEAIRESLGLASVAVLGHSWGGLLAMEYALRYPQHLSHLILMNSAFASHDAFMRFRQQRRQNSPDIIAKLETIAASAAYGEGDLATDAEYYRIHFGPTVRRAEQLEQVVKSLRANVTEAGIVKARAIEDRLMDETWLSSEYNLLPKLAGLNVPTLVIHGDYDLIPLEISTEIAEAIPRARLIVLRDTGHFAYLESPDEVCREIGNFVHGTHR